MGQLFFVFLGSISVGIAVGVIASSFFLREAEVRREAGGRISIRVPVLGVFGFSLRRRFRGIFVDEAVELLENLEFLSSYLDVGKVLEYSKEYEVRYVGFEGDREDGSWSPGKLAFYTPADGEDGGYKVFLNPHLDRKEVARRLSEETGRNISPDDVYPFLFLHELGHTKRAGNQNFYAAVVNLALAGRMRSLRRRRELFALRRKIEAHADRFALRELNAWRSAGKKAFPLDAIGRF